jgi:uncharacterized protein YndB with AHSA1/START domain
VNESDPVIIEVTLPAPVDAVWRALRDPAELRRWFGWDHEGLDEEIHYIFDETVDAAEDGGTLAWEHGDRFTLEAHSGQTILRVTRPAPAAGVSWDDVYDEITEGWITFVQQLRFALARHPGEDRRTVFLGGRAARDGGADLPEMLALSDPALVPGERYATTAVTGEHLTGEVWHRSAHQIGVTVDQYGDGLLLAAHYGASSRPPHGGADIVITTYGLDAAALAEVERRWRTWWREHFAEPGSTKHAADLRPGNDGNGE